MEIMKHNEKNHIMECLEGEEKETGTESIFKAIWQNLSILRRKMDTQIHKYFMQAEPKQSYTKIHYNYQVSKKKI